MVKKILEKTYHFRAEVKKTISSSLVAAFGLITGLAWKEVVEVYILRLVGPEQSKLLSAFIITIISVICIMIITKILATEEKKQEQGDNKKGG